MFRFLRALAILSFVFAAVEKGQAFPVERCVNLANGLDAPFEGAWGYRIEDAHIAAIAADGFDTIRLPVRFQAGYTGGRINPALLERVDHVIKVAFAHDLNVVLDLHHFNALMNSPEVHGELFVDIWRELSDRYVGWSNKLMFELLNEPHADLTTDIADALYDRVYPILRAAHPKRWIIVGGDGYSSRLVLGDLKRRDAFTAFTFHYYGPFFFTHQGATWVDPVPPKRAKATEDELETVRQHFLELADFPVPLFLGEFGVFNEVSSEDRAPWMGVVRSAAEAAGIGWCHWGFASGFRVVTDDLTWLPDLREALLER